MVDGLFVGKHFTEETMREVFAYKPRPDDVFIVTYPKCGTTWMQHIVYYIYNNGTPPQSKEDMSSRTPFFELVGLEGVNNAPRPAAIKTHEPFDKQPYSKEAKYIYVARNPFDCCVSFYHHMKFFPMYDFENGTFDEFLEAFLKGEVEFGDYFDHLLSWYDHKDDPNVLFLTYEDLKKDTRFWIQKVADFLGQEYGQKIRDDQEVLDRIMTLTSVDTMRKTVNPAMRQIFTKFHDTPRDQLPRSAQLLAQACGDLLNKPMTGNFVRKGQVGDWRSHFTSEQVKKLQERIALKTAGSDVMDLWKDLNLME